MALRLDVPDISILESMSHPISTAARHAVRGLQAVLTQQSAVAADPVAYDTLMGIYPATRLRSDLEGLEDILLMFKRFAKSNVWPVVAQATNQRLGQMVQYLIIDTAALHATMTLQQIDEETLVSTCARCFGIHKSQYQLLVSDCRKMLKAIMIQEERLAGDRPTTVEDEVILGKSATDRIVLNEDLPAYTYILQQHSNKYLRQLMDVVAPNEALSSSHIDVLNTNYVDVVVGVISLYHRLVKRFSKYRTEMGRHSSATCAQRALNNIQSELENLPMVCNAVRRYAVESLLACEIVLDTSASMIKWMGESTDAVTTEANRKSPTPVPEAENPYNLHRYANPSSSKIAHQYVVRQLLSLPKYAIEMVSELQDLASRLLLLQQSCETVIMALGKVTGPQSAVLFTLAQKVAAVLKDTRKLDGVLHCEVPRFMDLILPERVLGETMRNLNTPFAPNHESAASHLAADENGEFFQDGSQAHGDILVKNLTLISTVTSSIRHAVAQSPKSIAMLAQSLTSILHTVTQEVGKAGQMLSEAKNTLAQLNAAGDSAQDKERGVGFITAPELVEKIHSIVTELSPERRREKSTLEGEQQQQSAAIENEMCFQSDNSFVASVLEGLCEEFVEVEKKLNAVMGSIVDMEHPDVVEAGRLVVCFAAATELLGKALFLSEESMKQIGLTTESLQ